MRSRYDLMTAGVSTSTSGKYYPEIFSYYTRVFTFNDKPKNVLISQVVIDRFDLACYNEYGVSEYDDIVLWVNNISSIHELVLGEYLSFPSKSDISKFFLGE